MWESIFGKKENKSQKVEENIPEDISKSQNIPRQDLQNLTEKEIEKKAEDGMIKMGFTPVETSVEPKDEIKDDYYYTKTRKILKVLLNFRELLHS